MSRPSTILPPPPREEAQALRAANPRRFIRGDNLYLKVVCCTWACVLTAILVKAAIHA